MAEALEEENSKIASNGKPEQEVLSSTVKDVHTQLREQLYSGIPLDKVWSVHLKDEDTLIKYSKAMHSLAVGPWMKHGGGRIQWCLEACKEYFQDGGVLEKVLRKDLRRKEFGNPTQLEDSLLPKSEEDYRTILESFRGRRLELLDVGSCYNPFSEYRELLDVTAIDLAPAVESVLQCDFLNVKILSRSRDKEKVPMVHKEGKIIQSLLEESFDVVVFSLLLSYLPSTEQRMECCIRAHSLLALHGILLIVTADSSHQNRHVDMMKSWRSAIEGIGFQRWKYVKDVHLHCLGFRKTALTPASGYSSILKEWHRNITIPQDRIKE
ncbi:PREDICTED: probable methyltransferase BMT2 homolog [Amphimedon queenslandica]|uniref:S-adenosylmethionine sensor upstream of mTORC1 n=1 Tax=Amphimedon queenslandica TaxID=400682 RepID=A0A1X7VRJ1_AMPQE|nr:PREDICTED: probable methyltransferase BMT2 homolog [Amphimedon queenslandica]|eukprot:XP_003383071.1 PREDICTED: probable methyltransferase BMT2 homolog [Amphimedon queenslandica]